MACKTFLPSKHHIPMWQRQKQASQPQPPGFLGAVGYSESDSPQGHCRAWGSCSMGPVPTSRPEVDLTSC